MQLANKAASVLFVVNGFLLSPLCSAQAAPVLPAHPASAEQIRQLMAVTHMAERVRDSMHKMTQQQQATMTIFPPAFWADFSAEMDKVDWIQIATPVYQKYLSEDDASKAIAFYSTDTGQRTLDSSTAVSLDLYAKGSAIGKEIGTRLGEKYSAQIQENLKKGQPSQALPPK